MAEIEVTKPSEEALDELGVSDWPVWTCEAGTFDWHYNEKETCYVVEGEVTVTVGEKKVTFGPGNMVVFPGGLQCIWEVSAPVKKHYKFG